MHKITFNPRDPDLSLFAEGGEGIIYEYKGLLLKIYKENVVDIQKKYRKIKNLLSMTLPPEIVGPMDIVVDKKDNFIGYSMNKVEGQDFKRLSNKKYTVANGITTKDVLEMLLKIKNIMDKLHSMYIYIGDLNDQNILFNKHNDVRFIDCDSWTIGNDTCDVAMDLFKDPLLVKEQFNAFTDNYAFAILSWKSLTRIHPFAGTMKPDMDILQRMKKGISIIDNDKVKIPRTIKSWKNLSPKLIENFKDIFEKSVRLFDNSMEDMYQNLAFCKVDKDYYYSKYTTCPICDANAKLQMKPKSQGTASGLKLIPKLDASKIKAMFDINTYLDINDMVVSLKYNRSTPYIKDTRIHFMDIGIIRDLYDVFRIDKYKSNEISYTKRPNSPVIVDNQNIYYINKSCSLRKLTPIDAGINNTKIADCANTAYFEVVDGHYCIINEYDTNIIINIDGYNKVVPYKDGISEYGMHYDPKLDRWLIILEARNVANKFTTYIFDKNTIKYEDDRIKYQCGLGNICFSNSTIFIPIDGKIRGYSYVKNLFKDFECSVCDYDSKLIRNGSGFTIVNIDNIWTLTP